MTEPGYGNFRASWREEVEFRGDEDIDAIFGLAWEVFPEFFADLDEGVV